MIINATRFHDFSAGHRVCGHENKCASLHGHNYRVHFTVAPVAGFGLDKLGRVVDFGVINNLLCQYLENHFDHRFLIWEQDPLRIPLHAVDPAGVLIVPFNPTAENIAQYLLDVVGPWELRDTHVRLVKVVVEETRKCSASAELPLDEY